MVFLGQKFVIKLLRAETMVGIFMFLLAERLAAFFVVAWQIGGMQLRFACSRMFVNTKYSRKHGLPQHAIVILGSLIIVNTHLIVSHAKNRLSISLNV